MKSFEQLAEAAYEAYRQEVIKMLGPLPDWQKLPEKWKAAWIAVAKKLHADISAIQ